MVHPAGLWRAARFTPGPARRLAVVPERWSPLHLATVETSGPLGKMSWPGGLLRQGETESVLACRYNLDGPLVHMPLPCCLPASSLLCPFLSCLLLGCGWRKCHTDALESW